jgi:outer membrane lipoprotein carrier protein
MKSVTNKIILITFLSAAAIALAKSNECFAKLINNITTMEADYEQNVYARKGKIISSSIGHFMYKYPNLIRWQSNGEQSSIIINDGENIWQFEPELEQVIKSKTASNSNYNNPLNFLSDISTIKKYFNVSTLNSTGKLQTFLLTEKKSQNKITLTFSQKMLIRVSYTDQLNNLTEIKFTKIEKNKSISDKWFTFIPEENVEVIEQ